MIPISVDMTRGSRYLFPSLGNFLACCFVELVIEPVTTRIRLQISNLSSIISRWEIVSLFWNDLKISMKANDSMSKSGLE